MRPLRQHVLIMLRINTLDLQQTRFGVRMTFRSGLGAKLARIIHAVNRRWLAKGPFALILIGI